MPAKKKAAQNIIAIVYDFDGTLSPGNMQEETIFQSYGIDKKKFWERSQKLVVKRGYEKTLAYLKLLIDDPIFRRKPLTRKTLRESARRITYYPGVNEGYFDHLADFLNAFPEAREIGITIEHYIISSGLQDILDGVSIRKYFKETFACEFDFQGGRPVFPKLVINDTNKTQFLFRINKGMLKLDESINGHMPEAERRIPFRNMIYIADGPSDIPSFSVVRRYGGMAYAVYAQDSASQFEQAVALQESGRVSAYGPADYQEGSPTEKWLQLQVRRIASRIMDERKQALQRRVTAEPRHV